MTIDFFLPMIPPSVTLQEQKTGVRNGKPFRYDPPELKDARQKFTAMLGRQRKRCQRVECGAPLLPLDGPLRLVTKWIWPKDDGQRDGEWKITKPDTDNLIKLFKDCMTRTGYWLDDAQVCSEITEKFLGSRPGIYVRVEKL